MEHSKEVSSSYSGPLLISELTGEEQKSVEESIEIVRKALHECESYLHDYRTGEQTVLKLLQTMNTVKGAIIEFRSDLLNKHKVPSSLHPWLSD